MITLTMHIKTDWSFLKFQNQINLNIIPSQSSRPSYNQSTVCICGYDAVYPLKQLE